MFIEYKGCRVQVIRRGEKNTRIQYQNGGQVLVPTRVLFPSSISSVVCPSSITDLVPASQNLAPASLNLVSTSKPVQVGSKPTLLSVRQKALELMDQHRLTKYGWTFVYDEAQLRAGNCSHGRGMIQLSKHLVLMNDWDVIIGVLLHEIAHALVGPRNGHGEVWKAMCRKIGANPERCYDVAVVSMPKLRYQGTCQSCGRKFQRSSTPFHRSGWHHKECGRVQGAITWVDIRARVSEIARRI